MKFKKLLTTAMAAALAVSAFAGCVHLQAAAHRRKKAQKLRRLRKAQANMRTPSHWYGIPMNLQKIMTLPAANMLV